MATKDGSQNQNGGTQDFTLISNFTDGYRNREDITVLPPGVMVVGSQNILTNTHERIGIRKGYTLDGQSDTSLSGIGGNNGAMGTFDWLTSGGHERNMRAGFLTSAGNDGKLQFRFQHTDNTVEWITILDSLTSVDFNYINFWDVTQLQTIMLGVNNTPNIYEWNGAAGEIVSSTDTAGIIGYVQNPPNPTPSATILNGSGGVGYTEGDVLTITTGNGDAKLFVFEVLPGAIQTTNIHIGGAGSGYAIGDNLEIDSIGTPNFAHFRVLTVDMSGAVLTYETINNGLGYHTATAVPTVTSGSGSGFELDITAVGNGIAEWGFNSDADHGSGYSAADFVPVTGGTGTNASVSIQAVMSGTITKSGPETWAETGIAVGLHASNFQLVIDGVTYTYGIPFSATLGDTLTLYGISPDPTAIPAGSAFYQAVVVFPNAPSGDDPPSQFELPSGFNNALIGTIDQRVFIGSLSSSYIYISEVNSFVDWDTTSTGIVGAALQVVTTSPPTAFIPQEQYMYIAAGHDEWYNITFTEGTDLTDLTSTETATIQRLNTTAQQAAQTQAGTNKIANSIVFLSFEPIIETFGRVTDILAEQAPQMTDLSFPIVNDMNAYNLANAAVFYYRKFVYIAVPREGLVLVYNMTDVKNPYWEAPQVMPINRFSIIQGELYGHSSLTSETYKLFTGFNDNGFPIAARANFSFNNYGTRSQSKGYNEFYVEGYISDSTTLTLGVQYDIDGCATKTHFDIVGSDTKIVCIPSDSASLGKVSLGKNPLGGEIMTALDGNTPKFRVIKTFPTRYFYEDQISFTSEGIDEQWEILAFGPQLQAYTDLNNSITQ